MTCSERTVGVEVAKEDAEAGGRPAATVCGVKSHPGAVDFRCKQPACTWTPIKQTRKSVVEELER